MNFRNGGIKPHILSLASLVYGLATFSHGAFAGVSTDAFYENSSGTPVLGLIQKAKRTLDIETYTMNDPQVDKELRNAISRGVKVQVVEEKVPVGATCHPFGDSDKPSSQTPDCLRQQELVKFVNENGGQYVPFSKSLCGQPGSRCYQHGKIAIVDGATALISTGNFDATSLCDRSANPKNCDRDYTIVSQDRSVVSSLQTIFNNDLAGRASNLDNLQSPRLTVSPDSMKPIIDFIGSAKNTLQIETQYLNDPTMNQAIIDAANRGVSVSVMVSSACSFGTPKGSAVKKWNDTYSSFDEAGIKTNIFDANIKVGGRKGYLHAKTIIVDGIHAWVGSVNGSTTALTNNREFGIFFDDASLVASLNQYVSSDFSSPLGESWQDSVVCKYDHGGR
ncbi:MAG: phospholipase D-like domain-containing protein [Bdellovibrionota bacterium]